MISESVCVCALLIVLSLFVCVNFSYIIHIIYIDNAFEAIAAYRLPLTNSTYLP